MFKLGLTGSIATGKSTISRIFSSIGIPVFDADKEVHNLYCGEAVPIIASIFPLAIVDGIVNRKILSSILLEKPELISVLQENLYPLLQKKEDEFIITAKKNNARIIVLDIPLLFETEAEKRCNAVLVTYVSYEEQKRRAFNREGMSKLLFSFIISRQMPMEEKVRRAHFVLDSSFGIEVANFEIASLIRAISFIL